jgi:hypothetical protein
MLKYLIAAGVFLGASAPVLAEEYYVVRDTTTKKCTIVSQKPTTTTTTIVSDEGVTYKTETEAEAGMKKIKVCSSSD